MSNGLNLPYNSGPFQTDGPVFEIDQGACAPQKSKPHEKLQLSPDYVDLNCYSQP